MTGQPGVSCPAKHLAVQPCESLAEDLLLLGHVTPRLGRHRRGEDQPVRSLLAVGDKVERSELDRLEQCPLGLIDIDEGDEPLRQQCEYQVPKAGTPFHLLGI